MSHVPQYIWRYGNIDVMYHPTLDGCGSRWAPTFVEFIKNHFGVERRFGTIFEWCAGPAFIGFALLAESICDRLCLADINSSAIDHVNRTIKANSLQDRVLSYVSDNLVSVPQTARFDLVVGNPPNWYELNSAHPFFEGHAGWELRGCDPGWRVHGAFYSQIAPFLNPGAFVLVQEVEPYSREVFLGSRAMPWDTRPKDQATIFPEMIRRGGLTHIGDFELRHCDWPHVKSWLQLSQKPA